MTDKQKKSHQPDLNEPIAPPGKTDKSAPADTLKELEELLADDVMASEADDNRLIPRRDLTGIIIRMSVVMIFSLLLFIIGIFDNFLVVLVAVGLMAGVEALTIRRNLKARKRKFPFET